MFRGSEGYISAKDKNNTWHKIASNLTKFVKEYTGKDLEAIVLPVAESSYIKTLKKPAKSLEKLNVKLNNRDLKAIQAGALEIKIQQADV